MQINELPNEKADRSLVNVEICRTRVYVLCSRGGIRAEWRRGLAQSGTNYFYAKFPLILFVIYSVEQTICYCKEFQPHYFYIFSKFADFYFLIPSFKTK